MCQYLDMGDETLWNPSNGASRMFQRQVAIFEVELALPSGIGPMERISARSAPRLSRTLSMLF
ncbi:MULTISPECIES: DUF6086 family protein [Streptomyces griseus group]|uniref:DUF6086 family protein n=1 Tax=Streptomyces griseus group TaxID=629295 RepID=UPI0030819A1D